MNRVKTNDEADYSVLEADFETVKKYKEIMHAALGSLMEIVSMLAECKDQYPDRYDDFVTFDPSYVFMAEVVWAMNDYGIEVILPESWKKYIPL